MKQRLIKKLYNNGKLGKKYASINDRAFKKTDGDIIYLGTIKKNKYYLIKQISNTIKYKGRTEPLSPYQVIAIEIKTDINNFLRGKKSLEELSEIFS